MNTNSAVHPWTTMECPQVNVLLPRYGNVKKVILKYSSPLKLNSGVKFRICNICSRRLPSELSEEHREHLKLHDKIWNMYLVILSNVLQKEVQREETPPKNTEMNPDQSIDNSTSSSEDELNVYNVVDSLQHSGPKPPPLTTYEHILKRKFTHDKIPIRKYREITDWMVAKQCNVLKFNKIVDEIGDGICSSYLNPQQLYSSNSEAVSKISRLLCPKQCYYLPGECFFADQHALHFKDLMRKELHDRFNPSFETFMSVDSRTVPILQYNEQHQPKVFDLCNSIGITTKLEYNSEGYLDLNYDLFCKDLWHFETPLFVLEENKVFDVIFGLLSCASQLFSSARAQIAKQYSQSQPGLNPPVLSVMMHGPDLGTYSSQTENCQTERDERRSSFKKSVSHKVCKSMINEYHWMYKHHTDQHEHPPCASSEANLTRQGPASLADQSIVYPCNMGHWHECPCESCQLLKVMDCNLHKMHLKFNLENCLLKEIITCSEHKIDHPENVQPGDIVVQKNVLFHNRELFKNGRNYETDEIVLSGLKLVCKCCRRNTEDHFKNHLSMHPVCELCLFEGKTRNDKNFWNKVCNICGKRFDSELLKNIHKKKHDVERSFCELCSETFSSKSNFQRHLVEQHNVFLHANNGPYDGTEIDEDYKFTCNYCQKEFKYERNVVAHINNVHFGTDECECKICSMRFTSRFSLKRHLAEQHGVLNIGLSLKRETRQQYICSICGKEFNRRYHLTEHEKNHQETKEEYYCDICGGKFSSKSNLTKHKKNKHEQSPKLKCEVCDQSFHSLWHLNDHSNKHSENREVFPCNLCTKQFLSRWNLKRHVKLKH